jgi:hypothetical protein
MDETHTTEHLIHSMLYNSRIRGEWFYPSEEVMECIEYVNNFKFKEYIEKRNNINRSNITYLT